MITRTKDTFSFLGDSVFKVLMLGLIGLSFFAFAGTASAATLTVDAACTNVEPIDFPDGDCDVANTYQTLEQALSVSNDNDTILLNNDVTTSEQVNLKAGMTLDGNGNTLTAAFSKTNNSNNSAIGIQNSNVTVQNITLDGVNPATNQLHGVNVYRVTGVALNSVTVTNFRSGVVVNGSTVTAAGLNANGNAWNSVNVDPGSGVTEDSVFTLNSGNLNDDTQIWSDGANVTAGIPAVTVNATGYTQYNVNGTDSYLWSNSTPGGVLIGTVIYDSLQSAIAGATAGDTINLGAGTYTEAGQIVINESLSIVGDSSDLPVIQPTGDFLTGSASGSWWLIEGGVTFNLSNVVLDGNGTLINHGLRSHGNTTIDNVDFMNIAGNEYQGMAVLGFGGTVPGGAGSDSHSTGGSAAQLTVTNSSFSNIGRIGVLIKGTESTATLTGNTYTGKGDGTHLDYGFELGAGGSAVITGNTISGNRGVAADTSTSAGILVTEYYGSGTTAEVTGNIFFENSAGLHVGYLDNDTSIVTAHDNDFSGETVGVASAATTITVNAENNWWGSMDVADIDAKADGDIDFTPWYLSADMTLTSDAIVGDTLTSPTEDVALGEAGEADLPSGVTDIVLSNNANLDLSAGLDGDESVVLNSGVSGEPVVLTNSDLPGFSVSFSDGTTIDGPSDWDGIIMPPTTASVSGRAPSGFSVGSVVISVGSSDGTLTFDNPVTLVLPGVTGPVGYKPADSNTWVEITDVCVDYTNPTGAPAGGECSVTNGTDTKIVTYHFTLFGDLDVLSPQTGSRAKKATRAVPAVPGISPALPAIPSANSARTVAGAFFTFVRDLGIGARGEDVTELQNRLIQAGVYSGPVTGYFGPLTQGAVAAYQKKMGIVDTGYFGPLTRAEINKGLEVAESKVTNPVAQEQIQSLQTKLAELMAELVEKLKERLGQ